MNEMLLPSGETWNRDLSGFLKKSRNGISLARPGVLVAGGMGLRGVKLPAAQSAGRSGDTMEILVLQAEEKAIAAVSSDAQRQLPSMGDWSEVSRSGQCCGDSP
jgi:hypothetical protein